jgi:hypothetical protein
MTGRPPAICNNMIPIVRIPIRMSGSRRRAGWHRPGRIRWWPRYAGAPDDVVGACGKERLFKFVHLLPSLVLSPVLAVIVLPAFSNTVKAQVDADAGIVILYVAMAFAVCWVVTGRLIDGWLLLTRPAFRAYLQYLSFERALDRLLRSRGVYRHGKYRLRLGRPLNEAG